MLMMQDPALNGILPEQAGAASKWFCRMLDVISEQNKAGEDVQLKILTYLGEGGSSGSKKEPGDGLARAEQQDGGEMQGKEVEDETMTEVLEEEDDEARAVRELNEPGSLPRNKRRKVKVSEARLIRAKNGKKQEVRPQTRLGRGACLGHVLVGASI